MTAELGKIVDEIENSLPRTEAEIEEVEVEQAEGDVEAGMSGVKYSDRDTLQEYEVTTALYDALDHPDTGDENLINVGRMPKFIRDLIGVDGEFYLYRNHAYENMVTEQQAKDENRYSASVHYHGWGVEKMTDAILSVEAPYMTIASKTKDGNPAAVMILSEKDFDEKPLYGVLSFYADRPINGKFDRKPHVLLTIATREYFESEFEGKKYDGYVEMIDKAIGNGKVISFDNKMRTELPVIAKHTRLGNITDSVLNKNVSQFRAEVNDFKKRKKINYSRRDTSDGLTKEEARAQAQAYTRLKAENAALQRKLEYWQGQTKRTKQRSINRGDVDKYARQLVPDK